MIKRSEVRDRHGRVWSVAVVPKAEAEEEDFRFWYEELTPAQRVDLVQECLLSCLKAKGSMDYPHFEEFIGALNARGVRYLLVEAHAVAFLARPRITNDLVLA